MNDFHDFPDDGLMPVFHSESGFDLMNNETGYIIGARGGVPCRVETDKHLISIASTGGGKGTSVAITNLLDHKGSVFSVEIGGATYRSTWKVRKHLMGQNVYLIDPFGATGKKSDSLNLLMMMDKESTLFDTEVRSVAQSFLKSYTGAKPQDSFWEVAPLELLTALLIYVRTDPDVLEEDRNFVYVAELMADCGNEKWRFLMDKLSHTTGSKWQTTLTQAGNKFKPHNNLDYDITRLGITMSVSQTLATFHDKCIKDVSRESSFSINELKNKKATIYVVMPNIKAYEQHSVWLRLLVERAFAAFPDLCEDVWQITHDDRTLFMLDEFTQLGRLDDVESGMQTARHKGINIWAMLQDISRLKEVYGDNIASSILGAAGVTQVFDVGEEATTNYVSRKLGKRIVYLPSVSVGTNWGENEGQNWQDTKSTSVGKGVTISEGETVNETWSRTITDGFSDSTANTTGTNEGRSESIKTSPKNMFGFWKFGWKNHPSTLNHAKAKERDFGHSSGSQESTTSQHTTQHSQSDSHGGSTSYMRQRADSETNTDTTGRSDGGTRGTSKGGQINVQYTAQIIEGLDPSQVEIALSTNTNQIVFVRGRGLSLQLLERQARFYEIPMMRDLVNGDFTRILPVLEMKPLELLECQLEPCVVPQSSIDRDASLEITGLAYRTSYPLTSGLKTGTAPSPRDYAEAVRKFQDLVNATKDKKKIRQAQDAMYETFIAAVPGIARESASIAKSMREAFSVGVTNSVVLDEYESTLNGRAQALAAAQAALAEKLERVEQRAAAALKARQSLVGNLDRISNFEKEVCEYREYLQTLADVTSRWENAFVPRRPEREASGDESSCATDGDAIGISLPEISSGSFSMPEARSSGFSSTLRCQINCDEEEIKNLIPGESRSYGEILKKKIFGRFKRGVTAVEMHQALGERAAIPLWRRRTAGFRDFGFIATSDLRYYRDQAMSDAMGQLRELVEKCVVNQKTFKDHIIPYAEKLNKRRLELEEYAEELRLVHRKCLDLESRLDDYAEHLLLGIRALSEADKAIRSYAGYLAKNLASFEEWKLIEANKVRYLETLGGPGMQQEATNQSAYSKMSGFYRH